MRNLPLNIIVFILAFSIGIIEGSPVMIVNEKDTLPMQDAQTTAVTPIKNTVNSIVNEACLEAFNRCSEKVNQRITPLSLPKTTKMHPDSPFSFEDHISPEQVIHPKKRDKSALSSSVLERPLFETNFAV